MNLFKTLFDHSLKPIRGAVDARVNKELDELVKRIGEGTLTPQSALKDLPALIGNEHAQLVTKNFAVLNAKGSMLGGTVTPLTAPLNSLVKTSLGPAPKTPVNAIAVPTGVMRPVTGTPVMPGTIKNMPSPVAVGVPISVPTQQGPPGQPAMKKQKLNNPSSQPPVKMEPNTNSGAANKKGEEDKDDDESQPKAKQLLDIAHLAGVDINSEETNLIESRVAATGGITDEPGFVTRPVLQRRVELQCTKRGVSAGKEVVDVLGHALQDRLRAILEQLVRVSKMRNEVYKSESGYDHVISSNSKRYLHLLEKRMKEEQDRKEVRERERQMKEQKDRERREKKNEESEVDKLTKAKMEEEAASNTALAAIGDTKARAAKNNPPAANTPGPSAGPAKSQIVFSPQQFQALHQLSEMKAKGMAMNVQQQQALQQLSVQYQLYQQQQQQQDSAKSAQDKVQDRMFKITKKDVLSFVEKDPELKKSKMLQLVNLGLRPK
jgi:hypothetical protein